MAGSFQMLDECCENLSCAWYGVRPAASGQSAVHCMKTTGSEISACVLSKAACLIRCSLMAKVRQQRLKLWPFARRQSWAR